MYGPPATETIHAQTSVVCVGIGSACGGLGIDRKCTANLISFGSLFGVICLHCFVFVMCLDLDY